MKFNLLYKLVLVIISTLLVLVLNSFNTTNVHLPFELMYILLAILSFALTMYLPNMNKFQNVFK